MDTFVCPANKNGTEYFFFEAFDEPWKVCLASFPLLSRRDLLMTFDVQDQQFGGVEGWWGLFYSK
jgi:hypothetical protein